MFYKDKIVFFYFLCYIFGCLFLFIDDKEKTAKKIIIVDDERKRITRHNECCICPILVVSYKIFISSLVVFVGVVVVEFAVVVWVVFSLV